MNLLEKKYGLHQIAKFLFNKITSLPINIRPDLKKRTGIAVLIREIGTGNLIYFTVNEPSDMAQFLVSEKPIRSEMLGDYASQNSEIPDNFQYRGFITIEIEGKKFQFSCSGLKEDEDIFIDIALICYLFQIRKEDIIIHLKNKGAQLPDFESKELGYLKKLK